MSEPTLPDLHARVSGLEDWQEDAADDIKNLQEETKTLKKTMVTLESDMETIKQRLVYADAARDRQTEILLAAIDDTRKRALNQAPAWASSLITVLAMICAALLTAFYHH